jgi:hypothetical protein
MQTPRILALADVQMVSSASRADELISFYAGLLGLDHQVGHPGTGQIVFRGYPRRGPYIVIHLAERVSEQSRRRVLIQLGSLQDCLERLSEARVIWEEIRGWAYYDRRVTAFDPAGNLVGLVSYHAF